MTEAVSDSGDGRGWRLGTLRAADRLALAASPVFVVMALLTGAFGTQAADMLCGGTHASALTGMAAMYLLMSGFHLAP